MPKRNVYVEKPARSTPYDARDTRWLAGDDMVHPQALRVIDVAVVLGEHARKIAAERYTPAMAWERLGYVPRRLAEPWRLCPACGGPGYFDDWTNRCELCLGTGRALTSRTCAESAQ